MTNACFNMACKVISRRNGDYNHLCWCAMKLKNIPRGLVLLCSYQFCVQLTLSILYINKIQQDATVCRDLFNAKSLSTCFGCPSHPSSGVRKTVTAASGTATTFLQCGLIWPCWRKVVAQILWPVSEAVVTVLCTPDDGCDGHLKHVESDFAVKYLHTVASCWLLLI